MAYSFQTFSVGEVLTSSKMNQLEVNVRDHVHGTSSGVSATLGTLLSHLLFTDNTYDIGQSGATRPRDLFLSRNATIGGTVQLGADSAESALHTGLQRIATNTSILWFGNGAGTLAIKSGATGSGGDRVTITQAGGIQAIDNITAYYSDERLKTKLGSISGALGRVLSLDGFIYRANDLARSFGYASKGNEVGLSAQQVQQVLPEAVCLAPFDDMDGIGVSRTGEHYLTIRYEKLVPLLVEAIKELAAEVRSGRGQQR